MSFGNQGCVSKKSHKVKIEDGVNRLSLTEERPVMKVVHDETIGLFAVNEDPELTKSRARGWYLLARCTVHVCNSRDMFVDYQPVTGHEVVLDNNDHVEIVGFGKVKLQLDTGKILTLENVFHIPEITKCLVSVSKLTDMMDFTVTFRSKECVIDDGHEVVGKGYREDELYRLSILEKVVHDETIGLMVFDELPELTKARSRGWYLLTRCTVHVCNSRDMFVDYQPVTGHEVVLDNNDHAEVVGFGTVKLELDTGKILTLENVFHIPEITKCLVSVAKLTDMDFTVTFRSKECVIDDGHEVVGKGYKEDELYRLSLLEERPVKKVVHDETIGLMVFDEHPELTKARARGWYLLTRCTVHVCNSRDMFVDYEPVTGHEVVLVNNDHVEVAGFGTVKLELDTGKILTLENVFHIPEITKCLISVAKLTDMDFTVTFRSKECVIDDDYEVVVKGYREDELYRLSLMEERPVKKVVHNETIGLLVVNEHPELTKARARGWYLLTRGTIHVCNSRDMFFDYQPVTSHEMVHMENNIRVDVVGFGTVKLHLTTEKVLTLENVFHMPSIIKCCISVKKLTEMGLGVGFDGEGCYVMKGQQIVGNGFVEDGLFRLGVIDERSGGNQA